MTARDDETRIAHMMAAAQRAVDIGAGLDRDSFRDDSTEVLALLRLLGVMGEAARGISDDRRAANPDIPWREIIGTRNRIIHAYFDVDLDIVWKIVSDELPPLLIQLERMRGQS